MSVPESELEYELEQEWEGEEESEEEGEEFLGALGSIAKGLLGEGEEEYETELESEYETEWEGETELETEGEFEGEEFLGAPGSVAKGLLGEGEEEYEYELEGEEFFGRIARGIGRFAKRAAPLLKSVAKVAAPMIATAVGGPAAGLAARGLMSALGESEFETEFEAQFESEFEGEFEGELEAEFEAELEAPFSESEATAHMMASAAARSETEEEAEAMAGAATVMVLTPRERAALRRVLPHMVRGTAVLTRALRRRRATRPAVRAVPTIVRRTARTLVRSAQAGRPITRRSAAGVMARQTRRVLSAPRTCSHAIYRNVRGARVAVPRRSPYRQASSSRYGPASRARRTVGVR